MKTKSTVTMLSAIIALAMLPIFAFSQNNDSTPNAVLSFSVQNMGARLNSADNDIAPVISPSGLSLYFTSNRPEGQGLTDIWVAQRATLNAAWGAQTPVKVVNTSSNDVMSSISLDGRTMFLFSNRPGGMGGRDLYLSTRNDPTDDFGWTAPVNLGAVVNTAFDELGAAYFEDPTTGVRSIIFSSNRLGDPALDYHLYQSTRNVRGTFNAPTLINELSTLGVGAELSTAIRRDGLEIFITATRPEGLNFPLFDIWVATRATTTLPWNPPVLVAGINSLEDDRIPSLSPDGAILYFQSDRAGGSGGLDLYSATRCSLYSATPCTVNLSGGRTDISVFRPSK